jgi:hypothetical protein
MNSPGRWIFDVAVLIAVASAVWMAVTGNWDGATRFALITAFMLAARGADVPAPFAAAFAVFLLLSRWASVQHWCTGRSRSPTCSCTS